MDVGLEKYLTYKQKCLLILAGTAVTQQSEHSLNEEHSISLKQREGSSPPQYLAPPAPTAAHSIPP